MTPPQLIPTLLDDVSIQILARLPLSQHPIFYLVSKSWLSALKSSELFRIRSILGTSEAFLYLNLRFDSSFHWYAARNIGSKRSLVPLPAVPKTLIGPSISVLGPKIYIIGGSINDLPSNDVWIFDCRFNRWEKGPRMRVSREFSASGNWNGRIYVIGGCVVDNWSRSINWAEVFDPKTESWSSIPSGIEVRDRWMHASATIGSRFYAMADRGGVVYDMARDEWGNVPKRLDLGWRGRAAVVDDVLYCYDYLGKIRGYDVEKDVWKELRGLEKGLPEFLCSSTMVNLDGKLCVIWEGKKYGKEMDIMCAEIKVTKEEDGGLSGLILSLDVILVAPKGSSIAHCLSVKL